MAFKSLIISLFFSTSLVFAGECVPVKNFGCKIFVDESAPTLLYLRGHNKGRGHLPRGEWISSSKSAAREFKLSQLAKEKNYNILVSGSSHLPVTVDLLEKEMPFNEKVIIASHSGGYMGLWGTLGHFKSKVQIEKIVMLDNFYSKNQQFHSSLKRVIDEGTKCVGFLTRHNLDRYNMYYKKIGCQKDGPRGYDHNASVRNCLGTYLDQNSCVQELFQSL